MLHQKESEPIKPIISPISQEITQKLLETKGQIPTWMQGTFVRNGPVSIQIDNKKMSHWFDGLAMLHAFTFQNGKVIYTNKFLRSKVYNTVLIKKCLNFLGFDSLPHHPFWDKIKSLFSIFKSPPIQNANVNVTKIDHQCVALTEIPLPVRFELSTLETLGAFQFKDNLPQNNAFESAHPQYDRRTKEQFNYIVDFGINTEYLVYRYHPSLPYRELIGKIPVKNPAYMHSFALTEHYIILVEYPLLVNPLDLFLLGKPFIENYRWIPEYGTTFAIIDRKTGKLIRKIQNCPPFFAFHHVNAYEVKGNNIDNGDSNSESDRDSDNIILDIVAYEDARIVSSISQHGYLSMHFTDNSCEKENLPIPKLTRFTVSLKNSHVNSTVLFDGSFELPRINEMYNGYPYRYAYGSDQRLLNKITDARPIFKIDTNSRQVISWEEAGTLPGEPVFIPLPDAQTEDDGIILSIVLKTQHTENNKNRNKDIEQQTAFLLLLDAKSMTEIGRAEAPFAIPLGLHGQYFKGIME